MPRWGLSSGGGLSEMEHEILDGAFLPQILHFKLLDIFAELDLLKIILELIAKRSDPLVHEGPLTFDETSELKNPRRYTARVKQ